MNLTPLVRPFFLHKAANVRSWQGRIRMVQLRQLQWLLSRGASTKWGQEHGLDASSDRDIDRVYDELRRAVPMVQSYPDIRESVMRMVGAVAGCHKAFCSKLRNLGR